MWIPLLDLTLIRIRLVRVQHAEMPIQRSRAVLNGVRNQGFLHG